MPKTSLDGFDVKILRALAGRRTTDECGVGPANWSLSISLFAQSEANGSRGHRLRVFSAD
jgi:hypothetical protein